MSYLNLNKGVTAVEAAGLDPALGRDLLVVGTKTDVLAYDMEQNRDVFFKEVPDGVFASAVGSVEPGGKPLAVVGGNCSIQGFDKEGDEAFWTVTGDNVSAIEFCDIDGDGENELLVGSEDFEIRAYRNEEVLHEITEAAKVTGLSSAEPGRFAYMLDNGTVGLYDGLNRAWRVKSKHRATAVKCFDIDGDGEAEVISGWRTGKFEVRRSEDGSVLFRDNFAGPVAAIVTGDYRNDGNMEVIACGVNGEVRGYLPPSEEEIVAQDVPQMDQEIIEQSIRELRQQKEELQQELLAYDKHSMLSTSGMAPKRQRQPNVVLSIVQNGNAGQLELHMSAEDACDIRAVSIWAEGLFPEGDSHFESFEAPGSSQTVPLRPKRNQPLTMKLKVIVGFRNSTQLQVITKELNLPKFISYTPTVAMYNHERPKSRVTFPMNCTANNLVSWANESFSCPELQTSGLKSADGRLSFAHIFDKTAIVIEKGADDISVYTESMEVAGDVFQDLCAFFGINELESTVIFEDEMAGFRTVLEQVEEYNMTRLKLVAEVADSSNLLKSQIIKAEDSRMLSDMHGMRKAYQSLYGVNRDLLAEHAKRSSNHKALLEALKDVNSMIQKAARLRMGTAKTQFVTSCRQMLKTNNIHSLLQIMQTGRAAR